MRPAHTAAAVKSRQKTKVPGRAGRRVRAVLTAVVGIIAAAASATGMWAFMGHKLHIENVYFRAAVFSIFELALLISALRARAHRTRPREAGETDTIGPDAVAVWVFAAITGLLAASDETSWPARAGRIALPLVAAWLFERLIAEDRAATGQRQKIAWRFGLERVAVMVGLADPSARTTAEVDRDRRLAELARLAYDVHTFTGKPAKLVRLTGRYRKALADAVETVGLATDQKALHKFRANLAVLYQGIAATTPEALADVSPWAAVQTPAGSARGSAPAGSARSARRRAEPSAPGGVQSRTTSAEAGRAEAAPAGVQSGDASARAGRAPSAQSAGAGSAPAPYADDRDRYYQEVYAPALNAHGREETTAQVAAALGVNDSTASRARTRYLRPRYAREWLAGVQTTLHGVVLPDAVQTCISDAERTDTGEIARIIDRVEEQS